MFDRETAARTRLIHTLLVSGLLAGTLSATPATAAVFKVGPGGPTGCTHTTIAAAVAAASASPGFDEIRLLNGQTYVDTLLLIGPLEIEGGYTSCLVDTPTGTSTLQALADNRAVNAIANGQPITLSRLFITGGSVTGDGGGIRVSGSSPGLVTLFGVIVGGNHADGFGGGIFVDSSNGVGLTLLASGVSVNNAADGGGLACNSAASAAPSQILLASGSGVESNSASNRGGGLWIGRGCEALVQLAGTGQAIRTNNAASQGGGIYVERGIVRLQGTSSGRTHVGENTAFLGGGAYVDDFGEIQAENTEFFNNHANAFGGGIFVNSTGFAWLRSNSITFDCAEHTGRCVEMRSNDAATSGGALYVTDFDAAALLEGVHISGSSVSSATGSAVAEVRGGASLTLMSSVLWNNTGEELITAEHAGTDLRLLQNTVVANAVSAGLLRVGATDVLEIDGNLFWNQGSVLFASYGRPTPPTLRCNMTAAAGLFAGLPAGTVQLTTLVEPNPQFVNAGGGDFHLTATSPAIDACPSAQAPSLVMADLDGDVRNWDDLAVAGTGGAIRDIGADELAPFFADGFESGDTSAWDLTEALVQED